jgi:hypothetical protein
MPYASEKQRRFMYSQQPAVAKKFEREGNNRVVSTPRARAIERRFKRLEPKSTPKSRKNRYSDSDYAD